MIRLRHRAAALALLAGLALPLQATAQTKAPQKQPAKTQAPGQLETLYRQAEAAIEKQDFAAAVPLLEKFLADRPEEPYAHFQLGSAFTGLKRWKEAAAAFRKATELKPDFAEAFQNLGLVLLRDNRLDAATSALRKAVELSPGKPHPLLLLGDALERSGRRAEAIEQYEKAATLAPENLDALAALSLVLLSADRAAEAEKHLRQALVIAPREWNLHQTLIESLIAQKKIAEAASHLETHLALQPLEQQPQSWVRLATMYYQLKEYEKTLTALDHSESNGSVSARTRQLRADTYVALKRYSEAIELLKAAVMDGSITPEVRAELGRLYLELRDFPNAEKELVAALQAKPQLTEALRDLVAVLYLGEKYGPALNVIDQLAKREELLPGSWFIRATCYDKMQRKAEALEAYRTFVSLDRGRSERQDFQARQRIKVLARELEKKR